MPRPAAVSGSFYPESAAACRTQLDRFLSLLPSTPVPDATVLGGIVPHAGWVYSGATAGLTFAALGEPAPRCIVIFGAVHRHGVARPTIAKECAWETPVGEVEVDEELREEISQVLHDDMAEVVDLGDAAHRDEHSIEVQVPFVARRYPGSRILPVAVPPTSDAVRFGDAAGRVFAKTRGRVVVLGSTDLTHYGPGFYGFSPEGTGANAHRWAKETNDRAFLDCLLHLDAAGALDAATRRRSACGGGAAAATVAAVRAMGADAAHLLAHTTSYEVRPDPGGPVDFVGYASLVFTRARG